jgi:hypothetical protein
MTSYRQRIIVPTATPWISSSIADILRFPPRFQRLIAIPHHAPRHPAESIHNRPVFSGPPREFDLALHTGNTPGNLQQAKHHFRGSNPLHASRSDAHTQFRTHEPQYRQPLRSFLHHARSEPRGFANRDRFLECAVTRFDRGEDERLMAQLRRVHWALLRRLSKWMTRRKHSVVWFGKKCLHLEPLCWSAITEKADVKATFLEPTNHTRGVEFAQLQPTFGNRVR